MKCLYCGKDIHDGAPESERNCGWHGRCVRTFFGPGGMPQIDLDPGRLGQLADETVNKGIAVPGVQKKISLHLSGGESRRLTVVDYPTGFILKPQSDTFRSLPEYEALVMNMAGKIGIRVVPSGLVRLPDGYAYITRRVDREPDKNGRKLLAMEDFCQLSGRLTEDKYKGSYEGCSRIIKQYSSRPGLDMAEFYLRLRFCFVTGNSDMHLKIFSLMESAPGSRIYTLSPAYDLLPVNLIMPGDKEETALTIHGKKRNIRRKDFLLFAEYAGIPGRAAEKMMRSLQGKESLLLELCEQDYLDREQTEGMRSLIRERFRRLE